MRKLWLVTTDHLEEDLWFRDDEDFRVGMNLVAVQAACSPDVVVLAFILMSNHVHFVLSGSRWEVESFVQQFKHRYSIYYSRRWGIREFLRLNGVDFKEIPYEDEAPERAIAYVQMNCVAANICSHPSQYLYGTGDVFFSQKKVAGPRLGELSARARARLLHTYEPLPLKWHLGPEGFIPPYEYVDVGAVETFFRKPTRMNYFLTSSSKARKRLESEEHLPAFRDQIILAALPDLCRSLFGKDMFQELLPEERTELMRQIRFRFSADVNQIARVCGLSYAEAARVIDGI
jgi:REP element-mobilizing transposase RayT